MKGLATRAFAAGLAIAFALAGSVAQAQSIAGTDDLTPNGRGAYVSIAGAFDLYEIRAGELAAQRARNVELGEVGRLLAADHRQTTEQLLEAARTLGMDALPSAMMPMHWDMMRALQRASSSGFERLFLRQQIRVHEIALALHRNYAANGDAPALREVAETAIPVAERHLARVRQLSE